MDNRLTEQEKKVLDSCKLYWNYRSPENYRHLERAIREWRKDEIAKAKAVEA